MDPTMMAPCSSPAVFQQDSSPWIASTPDVSPRWHGKAPSASPPTPPEISNEMIRSVCEPFFEQMLASMQQLVQQQMVQSISHCFSLQNMDKQYAAAAAQPQSFQSGLPLHDLARSNFEHTPAEADKPVAFATLFPDPADLPAPPARLPIMDLEPKTQMHPSFTRMNEHVQTGVGRSMTEEWDTTAPPAPPSEFTYVGRSIMVCRHWRAKGWCRMGGKCKFQHPQHKRGVLIAKVATEPAAGSGMNGVPQPGGNTVMNTTSEVGTEHSMAISAIAKHASSARKGAFNQHN